MIRGGYGIFYDAQSVNSFDSAGASNGATSGIAYNPVGTNREFQLNATNIIFQARRAAFAISPGYRTPYSQNFNLNMQSRSWQLQRDNGRSRVVQIASPYFNLDDEVWGKSPGTTRTRLFFQYLEAIGEERFPPPDRQPHGGCLGERQSGRCSILRRPRGSP